MSERRALRIAMRFLRACVREGVVVRDEPWNSMSKLLSSRDEYKAVAAVDPALASDTFIDGGDE